MILNPLLRAEFGDICRERDHSKRGRRFEDWLRTLFTSEGLKCGPSEEERDKGTTVEEIDGWFQDRSGVKYIIEARWRNRLFGRADAYVFNQKLRHRPKTWGAVFSMSGFTKPATTWLATEDAEPRVVLFGPRDIETILRQDVNLTFRALLRHKREQRRRRRRTKAWRPDVDGSDIRRLDICEVRCFDAGSEVYRLLIDPSDPEGHPTLLAATHAGVILRVDARDLSLLGEIVVGPDPVRGLCLGACRRT